MTVPRYLGHNPEEAWLRVFHLSLVLSVLFQSLFQHATPDKMYTMPKRRTGAALPRLLVQGSSYRPRAYAILTASTTPSATPTGTAHAWLHSNAAAMMWKTKKRIRTTRTAVAPEPRFDGDVRVAWLERFATPGRRGSLSDGVLALLSRLRHHWWQIAFMLPFHFVLGRCTARS